MRFRSLMLTMLLLMIFSGYSYAETKPRKMGIGFRFGYTGDATYLEDDDSEIYVNSVSTFSDENGKVNQIRYPRFPLFIQFDETLINNWVNTSLYIKFEQIEVKDVPPVLVGTSYSELVSENTFNGVTKDFSIKKNQTKTDIFSNKFPNYKSKIEAASEPSLSSDYSNTTISIGKRWEVFIPIKEKHRILQPSLAIGLSYMEANFYFNMCDPYVVEGNLRNALYSEYRKGICTNKSFLFGGHASGFAIEGSFGYGLYSFIGETIELNIFDAATYAFYINPTSDVPVVPIFGFGYVDIVSMVYHY